MNSKFLSKIGVLLLSVIVSTSCVKSYDVDTFVKPQMVLNSLLTPDSTIKIELYWSRKLDASNLFERVVGAKVTLKENDNIIFEAISQNTALLHNYHPKSGARYDISIETAGEPLLSATTTVPQAPDATCTFIKKSRSFNHYHIENVKSDKNAPSLLLTAIVGFDHERYHINPNDYRTEPRKIYTTAQFADKYNMATDNSWAEDAGSSDGYTNLRVETQHIDKTYPLSFSIMSGSEIQIPIDPDNAWDSEFYTIYLDNEILLITPSTDYDKYYKTLQQWKLISNQGDIFNTHSIRIHSNIEGGLGIFAAYNQKSFFFSFNQE